MILMYIHSQLKGKVRKNPFLDLLWAHSRTSVLHVAKFPAILSPSANVFFKVLAQQNLILPLCLPLLHSVVSPYVLCFSSSVWTQHAFFLGTFFLSVTAEIPCISTQLSSNAPSSQNPPLSPLTSQVMSSLSLLHSHSTSIYIIF